MANITRRVKKDGSPSFLIRVFVDENGGRQKIKSMTWTPKLGMSERAIEKEVNRQATLFEDKVRHGLISLDGSIQFREYAARWMAGAQLAPTTRARYEDLLKRINSAIGDIRLEKLQAHHLEEFYQNLKEAGIKEKGRYAIAQGLDALRKSKELSKGTLAARAGVAPATIGAACRGDRITIEKAAQIAAVLNVDTNKLFQVCNETTGLSDKTILHHHRLISAILGKAKRERLIPFNVALEHATAPRVQKKEAEYLDDEQARKIVDLLMSEEDIRVKTAILLLLYSGLRRGELCGLNWEDVDFTEDIIHVKRASQYQKGKGIVEVPTKNESSVRTVKLPATMMDILVQYKRWWMEYRLKVGAYWNGKDNRLFVQDDGTPINPDTINFWLDKFTEENHLSHMHPHELRHTFATLQIAAGVDLRTLQARTGHAQASTLVDIYSHALKSAAEAATNALDDMLTPTKYKHNA